MINQDSNSHCKSNAVINNGAPLEVFKEKLVKSLEHFSVMPVPFYVMSNIFCFT